MEVLAIILFALIFFLILKGYPVAFTLGGVSILFGLAISWFAPDAFHITDFKLLAPRIMGTMKNYVLIAVPLFIFMGIMLWTVKRWFGHIRSYCGCLACGIYWNCGRYSGNHGLDFVTDHDQARL